MKTNKFITLSLLFILFCCCYSCNKFKSKAKEGINKSGEMLGKGGSEFISGVSDGIDKSLEVELILSDELKSEGLNIGRFLIENDSTGGIKNTLVVYFIFNKDINKQLSTKVYLNESEYGRSNVQVSAKAQDAKYIEFHFDKRVQIENKSKIVID